MLDKRNFKTKAIIRKKGEMGGQKKKREKDGHYIMKKRST